MAEHSNSIKATGLNANQSKPNNGNLNGTGRTLFVLTAGLSGFGYLYHFLVNGPWSTVAGKIGIFVVIACYIVVLIDNLMPEKDAGIQENIR